MRKGILFLTCLIMLMFVSDRNSYANPPSIRLGDDVLITKYHHLIDGKRIGLITNQTGMNSQGQSIIDVLAKYHNATLAALYGPEHGIDGQARADAYVESYIHKDWNIPVYSLYGKTRKPTANMLKNVDVLVFDLQDIGARSYTSISTLHDVMEAARENKKPLIVLDRPNPLGGKIVDGPVLKTPYLSNVGVDELPMAHGMTIGELAQFFNRKIGVHLTIIPMDYYARGMIFQDTGLKWVKSSPQVPSLASVFGYLATGLGEGVGLQHSDNFKWVGAEGIHADQLAKMLNDADLPGVVFVPETKGIAGGVRLQIIDYHSFNPARTGMYVLAYANQLTSSVMKKQDKSPDTDQFDKVIGGTDLRKALARKASPEELEALYAPLVNSFKMERLPYLIYEDIGKEYMGAIVDSGKRVTVEPKPDTTKPESKPESKPKSKPETSTTKPVTKPTTKPDVTTPVPGTESKPDTKTPEQKPDTTTTKPVSAQKVAHLTFDDGPSNVTVQILDVLKQHNIKATFFVLGRNVKGNEAILQRMIAEGHTIGNHTYSHDYNKIYKNPQAFFTDLKQAEVEIQKITGEKPSMIRFPGGSNNGVSKKAQDTTIYGANKWVMNDIVKEAKNQGYSYFDWNVSSGDARSNSYSPQEVIRNVKNGSANKHEVVILMHDTKAKESTLKALPQVIADLQKQGFTFEALQPTSKTVQFLK
ncbi:exo-beta-N-acetylmuramidase NamZ domain-containing protein [Brevibacillus laterosporus]|uniref:exo-beta-N-acetylmuramidase NamZ domain-containing protein n=1 Tax=Brevibacillus laterosporus TaxID=1465 RepID=UPI000B9BC5C2|nr:exo-beta-N-acetylmuramidase NamZ domain-containing protein [Brevibacillus laterosporus]